MTSCGTRRSSASRQTWKPDPTAREIESEAPINLELMVYADGFNARINSAEVKEAGS